jgi:hypothetical protein
MKHSKDSAFITRKFKECETCKDLLNQFYNCVDCKLAKDKDKK